MSMQLLTVVESILLEETVLCIIQYNTSRACQLSKTENNRNEHAHPRLLGVAILSLVCLKPLIMGILKLHRTSQHHQTPAR